MDCARFDRRSNAAAESPPCSNDDRPGSDVERQLFDRLHSGLELLWRSYVYAADLGTETWDFAVEIQDLLAAGLSRSDLRWLLRRGIALHAREVSLPGESKRAFHPSRGEGFTRRSCFTLSDEGAEQLRAWYAVMDRPSERLAAEPALEGRPHYLAAESPLCVPRWDSDLQELRLGSRIIKQFKVPAPNQEMVLAAFEEEGWPPRIDDPLPPQADQDPKRRLHDTIISLNRNHKSVAIRFMGDGSGTGVRWTRVEE